MTKLEQIIKEIREDVAQTTKNAEERIESLLEKYGDLDLKNYDVEPVLYGKVLKFRLEEEQLPMFIRDFRGHFGHKGEISGVYHVYSDTFCVYYEFDEDFEAVFYTITPEKYLKKGCRVEETTSNSITVVCDL